MPWHFETILEPIGLTEGPAWDGSGLLFTNIPYSRVMRYDPTSGSFTSFREGTNRANGLMFDAQGRLYACEGGTPGQEGGRRIVRYEPDGGVTVVCDRFQGKKLNSPNDLAIDAQATTAATWNWTTNRSSAPTPSPTARGR
jgi:gluconolactonase